MKPEIMTSRQTGGNVILRIPVQVEPELTGPDHKITSEMAGVNFVGH